MAITGAPAFMGRSPKFLPRAVGADRSAILKYVKSRTFNTIMGEPDLRKQNAPVWWTVGQWQDGVFEGVKGTGTSGEKTVRMKTGW